MTIMHLTSKGAAFLVAHEGFVSKAYSDPVGILTIGTGFTMRSKVAKAYWMKKYGRPLKRGDRITRAENDALLVKAIDKEYGPPVLRILPPAAQPHHFDAGSSVTFNCGPGATKWKWAQALARGDVEESARRLMTTAVTARGRRLKGLVRRRKEEAKLLLDGDYGHVKLPSGGSRAAPSSKSLKLCAEYAEKLKQIGFHVAENDGIFLVKKSDAVFRFQTKHPDLVNDGILGRGTMAQIDRDVLAREDGEKTGAVVTGITTIGGPASYTLFDKLGWYLPMAMAALAACALIWFIFNNWPEVKRWALGGDYTGPDSQPIEDAVEVA